MAGGGVLAGGAFLHPAVAGAHSVCAVMPDATRATPAGLTTRDVGKRRSGRLLQNVPERVRALVAVLLRVGRVPDADAIEDEKQRAHAELEPDRMPRGFHFHAVENPIRIFRFRAAPFRRR